MTFEMGNMFCSPDNEKDLVQNFSSKKPRAGGLKDDVRMFQGTKEALLAIGDGVEYPKADSTREFCADWWQKMGPIFADVMAGWSGKLPVEIHAAVTKTDLTHEGVPVRVLKATTADKDMPVIVYFHGGGFAAWSYNDVAYDNYLTRVAALGKCIVVAVDFRLTPDHPFPTGLDDCFSVTKWVVSGGATGVPGGRVLLAGDSAGANLAFGVALKAKQETLDLVKGIYTTCPYFAGETKSPDYPSMLEFDGYFASEGFLNAVVNGLCEEKEKATWFQSPLLWTLLAQEDELKELPPCRTVVMQLDMIRDMGIAMHYKLRKAGVESSLSMFEGVHEQQLFTEHSPQVTDESIHDLARFASYVSQK